jgi:hypothetical protein
MRSDFQSFPPRAAASNRGVRILWGFGGLLLAVGVILTAGTLARHAELARKLDRRAADAVRLERLFAEAGRSRAALEAYEDLGNRRPADLARLVDAAWPGGTAEIRESSPEPAIEGWRIRRAHVILPAAAPAQVGRLVESAADGRPPWILRECSVTALRELPGLARIVMVFEALEQSD